MTLLSEEEVDRMKVLLNQVRFPDTRSKPNAETEVCSRERVSSQGSEARSGDNGSQICLPKGSGCLWDKAEGWGTRRNVIGDKKKVRQSFCAGATDL